MSSPAFAIEGRRGPIRRPLWRRIAERWAEGCACGELRLGFADGSSAVYRGSTPGPSAEMVLNRGRTVWRMLARGDLGLAEAYMDGDWTTPDLTALIEFGFANESALEATMSGSFITRWASALRFRLAANSRRGARRNIAHHYDLGNAFYAEWLDETMTYSSAIFPSIDTVLAEAQREKYRQIVATLGIRPGDRVLEIGCGWGGFAEYAAREAHALVTAITISGEQAKYATERIAAAGLGDRVDVRLEDYRDTTGTFDHVVSIEMFEAVGEENWPAYFEVIDRRLRPGGRALLQVITVPDERFAAYRRRVDFIQRYIFPGGMLASPASLAREVERARLVLGGVAFFGASYAETLRRWNERFQARWDTIRTMRFDERFRRMWTYYLNSCEACFRNGATDVGHFLIEKPSREG